MAISKPGMIKVWEFIRGDRGYPMIQRMVFALIAGMS